MDLTIPLVLQSKTPIYLQIYQYIKREISHGSLLAGTRLPSHRNLAVQLNVSRITVESAYQQLLAEGYVESKPKRGIFVANVDIDVIQKKQQITSNSANNKENEQYDYDCSQGLIDQKAFPITNWKKHYRKLYFNMKMNYLLKKIHKVSSFYENIFQSICIMLAGYILRLIKL